MTEILRTYLAAKFSLRAVSRAALGCLLGAALLAAGTPARAGDDDDEAFDTKLIRGMLESMGLQSGRNSSIEYRERSPLVIPPSHLLPPPETDAAANNPNWPVDQEIKRAKQLKAAERNKIHTGREMEDEGRVLKPDELNKGQRTSSSRDAGALSERESARPSMPSELGYKGGMFGNVFGKDNRDAKFTGEPPRASLTDPPSGYQTPSPSVPYGQGPEDRRPKVYDPTVEHGTRN